jgi:hypothetical protein
VIMRGRIGERGRGGRDGQSRCNQKGDCELHTQFLRPAA